MKKLFAVTLVLLTFLASCGNSESKKIDEIVKDGVLTREKILRLKEYYTLEEIAQMSKVKKAEIENLEEGRKKVREEFKKIKLGNKFVGSTKEDKEDK
ncbi:hypothetical protein [Streptobacillus moniliformis]|uniref:hypothetical protein n=1 Tax=Streptobacillus moniliformis TaxID=34105 RepID=UPI0007E2F971|nr:hypothetical protein [Streptobacillus moniliformis]